MATLADIRADAKEKADMTTPDVADDPDFVTDAQWLVWINAGIRELHDVVTTSDPDTYFATVDEVLTSASNVIDLDEVVMRVRGVTLNPDTPRAVSLKRYNFADRDLLGTSVNPFAYRDTDDRRYRVVSRTTMVIEPKSRCAGTYRIFYVPRPTELVDDEDELDDALAPWWHYISGYAAALALDKEESFQQAGSLRTANAATVALIHRAVVNDDGSADGIADVQGWDDL